MNKQNISRESAIALLRQKLASQAEPGKSTCQVVQERGEFCRGFSRYSNEELRARFPYAGGRDPGVTRLELERRAGYWQLRRQIETGSVTSCDAQWQRYETCRGWDDFTNEDLARFCNELLHCDVVVTGTRGVPVI